jgi:uncharacterized repeat protein (TIGR02543 family)
MKTKTNTTSKFARRAVMTLLAVLTTTVQMGAWERTKPVYYIEFCKGGIGEVCVYGWAFDPVQKDKPINLSIRVATAPKESDDDYDVIESDWYEESVEHIYLEGLNSIYGLTGNHGFIARIPIESSYFGDGPNTVKTFYVKIYARTFEYNEDNPYCKDYEFQLNDTYVVTVVNNPGYGTEEIPYYVFDAADWNAIADVLSDADVASFYKDRYFQLADEDVNGIDFDNSTPITKMWGTSNSPFAGCFDGKGKTLNVSINSTEPYAAPFRQIDHATIRNLTVEGTVSSSGNHAAGLVGGCSEANTIRDCVVHTNISGSPYAGGIVGHGGSGRLTVGNCIYDGTISGFSKCAGGFLGWCDNLTLTLYNCLFNGSFTSGGGKYHPIACKYASATAKAPVAGGVYYLNTIAPSEGLDNNVVSGAGGVPVSETREDGVWDEQVTAIDGKTYFAAHFNGQSFPYEYGFEDNDLGAAGWTTADISGETRIASMNEYAPRSGDCLFQFAPERSNQYLISPEFSGHSNISLSFYYCTNAKAMFQVGYSTTNDIEAFAWDNVITSTGDFWSRYEGDFPKGTKFIAIKRLFSDGYLYVDDFKFSACNTPSPINLFAYNVTEHIASPSWEAPIVDYPVTGYVCQYKKSGDEEWSSEVTLPANATSTTISGLQANTAYDFHIKTLYGENAESAYKQIQFYTAIEYPYDWDFENGMDSWTAVHLNPEMSGICREAACVGLYGFRIHTIGEGFGAQYLISPRLSGTKPVTVTFRYGCPRTTLTYSFLVGYSTTTSEPDAFIWGEKLAPSRKRWKLYENEFPEGTKYVAINFDHDSYSNIHGIVYFDDFSLYENASQLKPTDLAFSNMTEHGATIKWSPVIGAKSYAYQYKKTTENSWSAWATATATSVTLVNLTENTDYVFRVRTIFSGDNSSHYATIYFQTEAHAVSTLPYQESFENGMAGWRVTDGDFNAMLYSTSNKYSLNGNCCLQLFGASVGGQREGIWALSPQLSFTGPVKISFYYTQAVSPSHVGFVVGYSTSTKDPANFTWFPKSFTTYENNWQEYVNYLPAGTKYVAIKWSSGAGDLCLDDFRFESTTASPVYQQVVVSNITATSADVSWIGSSANTFELEYREATQLHQDFESCNEGFLNGQQGWSAYDRNGNFFHSAGTGAWQCQRANGSNIAISINYRTVTYNNSTYTETLDIDDWLYTPRMTISGGTLYFQAFFFPLSNDFDGEYDKAEVLFFKSAVSSLLDPDSQRVLATIEPSSIHTTDQGYYEISLSDLIGEEGYIAFRHRSKHDSWLIVDNVNIYRTSDNWTSQTSSERNITLTGLSPQTTYEYRMRLWNGSHSEWSDLATFTTDNYIPLAGKADVVAINDGQKHDVILQGYTLHRDGSWNTLCLPFSASLEGSPLEGAIVKRMNSSDFTDGTLTLNFTEATTIDAGKPYIVKWADGGASIDNPLFKGVTISNIAPTPVTFQEGCFTGTYGPIADTSDLLLDCHNTGNGAFHAVFGSDRSSIGDDFAGWYTDAAMSSPATAIPFDADGRVTLYAGWGMNLADASDNSATIEAVVASGNTDHKVVVLKDRTLSRDGEWNTLCLPFSMDATQIASSSLADATLRVLDAATSNFSGGTLTLNFKEVAPLEEGGDGGQSSPSEERGGLIEAGQPFLVKWTNGAKLIINTDAEWTVFAQRVETGETFAGKNVLLGADIHVSDMVGTADHPFCGTFDGNGHTLDVSINDSGAEYAAPFRYIRGATIRNVKVTGSVKGRNYCAGIVGAALGGTNSIHDCWMAASVSGPSSIGGILGHGTTSATTISNCMLTGNLSSSYIGVFCGGGSAGGTLTLLTCWATGIYSNNQQIYFEDDHEYIGDINLVMTDGGTINISNCMHHDERITQGTWRGLGIILIIGGGSVNDSRYVDFLGSQWTLNDNGGLMLKPSADIDPTDIENPVFPGGTIDNSAAAQARQTVSFTGGKFIGGYSPVTLTTSDLLFSDNSTVFYPVGETTLNACRAYIQLDDATVTSVVLNFNDGTTVLPGDVNGDGKVTPADAIMILYHYFGVTQNGFNEVAADLNGDHKITPADAIETLYKYFGAGSNGARAIRMTEIGVKEPE